MTRVSLIIGGALAAASPLVAQKKVPTKPPTATTVSAPRFEVDMLWPKPMPNRWILGSVTGLAVDSRDHIYVLNVPDYFTARTEIGSSTNPPTGDCCSAAPAVLEYDAEGTIVGHWGGPGTPEWPTQPRGLAIDKEGNVWIGGSGGNDTRILKFSRDGKFISAIGKPAAAPAPAAAAPTTADTAYTGASNRGGSPGRGAAGAAGRGGGRGGRGRGGPALPPNSSSTEAFGGAAGISFDPTSGDMYVADGYRNRRVAVVDAKTGTITRFWGANGKTPADANDPSQFSTVACARTSKDGMIYVCDRANDRVQVFRKDGSFVSEKKVAPNTAGTGSVWDIAFSNDPAQKYIYVADGMNQKIWILDRKTLDVVANFGDGGRQPGQFYGVTNIATDSKGNLYTGEFYEGKRVQKFVYRGIGKVPMIQGTVWPSKGER